MALKTMRDISKMEIVMQKKMKERSKLRKSIIAQKGEALRHQKKVALTKLKFTEKGEA